MKWQSLIYGKTPDRLKEQYPHMWEHFEFLLSAYAMTDDERVKETRQRFPELNEAEMQTALIYLLSARAEVIQDPSHRLSQVMARIQSDPAIKIQKPVRIVLHQSDIYNAICDRSKRKYISVSITTAVLEKYSDIQIEALLRHELDHAHPRQKGKDDHTKEFMSDEAAVTFEEEKINVAPQIDWLTHATFHNMSIKQDLRKMTAVFTVKGAQTLTREQQKEFISHLSIFDLAYKYQWDEVKEGAPTHPSLVARIGAMQALELRAQGKSSYLER